MSDDLSFCSVVGLDNSHLKQHFIRGDKMIIYQFYHSFFIYYLKLSEEKLALLHSLVILQFAQKEQDICLAFSVY